MVIFLKHSSSVSNRAVLVLSVLLRPKHGRKQAKSTSVLWNSGNLWANYSTSEALKKYEYYLHQFHIAQYLQQIDINDSYGTLAICSDELFFQMRAFLTVKIPELTNKMVWKVWSWRVLFFNRFLEEILQLIGKYFIGPI